MEFKTIEQARDALEDYEKKLRITKVDIIDAKQQIARLKREMKENAHPSRFILFDSTPVSDTPAEQNMIIRKNNNGHRIEKMAKFWSIWGQLDKDGKMIMMWQGPSRTDQQLYPEVVKSRFVGYVVNYKPEGAGEATTFDNYEEEQKKYQEGRIEAVKINRRIKDPAIKSRREMMDRVKKSNQAYWENRRKKSWDRHMKDNPNRVDENEEGGFM